MWNKIILVYLAVSLIFYCLLAGADFGAGMIELFGITTRDKKRLSDVVTHAMGPVWEANHVWIILALVIFFNAFPKVFSTVFVAFHLPLMLILVGIVLRGCAFTFRHYDAVQDKSQRYYSWIFQFSSLVTSYGLGFVAGGLMIGRTGLFSIMTGFFTCAVFTYLAAAYMIGETNDKDLKRFLVFRAKQALISAVIFGLACFVAAHLDHFQLITFFLNNPVCLFCMVVATILIGPVWLFIGKSGPMITRSLVAAQVVFILLGWLAIEYQVVQMFPTAPDVTLRYLSLALIAGTFLIFPAFFYLLYVFKAKAR